MSMTYPQRLSRCFIQLPQRVDTFPYASCLDDPETFHHLCHVRRLNVGDHVMTIDGERELAYIAEVTELAWDRIYLKLVAPHEPAATHSSAVIHVTLGAALIKGQRWDWMIQKATELGCRTIVPLETERAVVHVGTPEKKRVRWQTVARSAAEQSMGLFIPRVECPMGLAGFCEHVRTLPVKIVLVEHTHGQFPPLRRILRQHAMMKAMAFAVGPEGGWTGNELGYLQANGFKFASFGQRILRSETASMALLSALAYEYDTV